MEFFNNSINDNLKFKLNSDGVDLNRIEPRLILTTKNNENYFFIGEIKGGICEFEIPELKLYEKGDYGKIKFEIISEDENYFPVWEDKFEVKTKATIKLEEMVSEVVKQSKPKITSDIIFEKRSPVKENKVENPFIDKLTEKLSNVKIEDEEEFEEIKEKHQHKNSQHSQEESLKIRKFNAFKK